MPRNQHNPSMPSHYDPVAMAATVARVEEKIDTLIEYRKSHEIRITALEKKAWWLTGLGAAGVFIGNFIFDILKKLKP